MFSSNQHFEISGSYDQLASVIDFAIQQSDSLEMFTRKENQVSVAYQKTDTGLYLIGSGSMEGSLAHKASDGWTDYHFTYDKHILAGIVRQWLEKQTYTNIYQEFDGITRHGFLCCCLNALPESLRAGIKNGYCTIIAISPYTLFYSK